MRGQVQRVHFVGIGGAGMSGIAELLHASGYTVTGSDQSAGSAVERLRSLGIQVAQGHAEANVGRADVVVYSSAIPATNVELRAARAQNIPVIPRAEMLAELMRLRHGIAVAGAHGKTTTTSLIGTVLEEAGLDPTVVVGGRLHARGANSRLGSSDLLVAEADESDGSFLRLAPTNVVITNVDREHLDHYGDFETLCDAFVEFANRVPFYGSAVLCIDDPHVQALLPRITRRTRTYGISPQAEIRADEIQTHGFGMRFQVLRRGEPLGVAELALPGRHNVQNALATIAIALELGVAFADITRALASFRGVARRFERHGERAGVTVFEDYAHHPAEIRATLAAARPIAPARILVAFQPHRYTRTRDCLAELAGAFHDADVLVLTEIYGAGEPKIPGIDGTRLAELARAAGHRGTRFVPDVSALVPALRDLAQPGDWVLFMGAGDIGRQAKVFLEDSRD
jgi:UDP-N-acetylmuramate--alanine ligase